MSTTLADGLYQVANAHLCEPILRRKLGYWVGHGNRINAIMTHRPRGGRP